MMPARSAAVAHTLVFHIVHVEFLHATSNFYHNAIIESALIDENGASLSAKMRQRRRRR